MPAGNVFERAEACWVRKGHCLPGTCFTCFMLGRKEEEGIGKAGCVCI